MSFSDGFNTNAGQALGVRTGWTLGAGSDDFKINAGATALTRTVSGVAFTAYYRDDDLSTTQTVSVDQAFSTTTVGLFVLGSGSSSATFNGYSVRRYSDTNIRLHRFDNGVQTLLTGGSITVGTLTGTHNIGVSVHLDGSSNPVIQAYVDGVAVGSAITDSSGSKHTSGRRGIFASATGAAADIFANYVDDYSTVPFTITEQSPSWGWEGVRQTSSFAYTVSWTGSITTLEAQIQTGPNVGDAAVSGFGWSTKIASPNNTTKTGSAAFTGLPNGGPYYLAVRDSANPSTSIKVGQNKFNVGLVIMIGLCQSQGRRLGNGVDLGGTAAIAGLKASYMTSSDPTSAAGAISLSDVLTNYANIGSAIVGACNQWYTESGGIPVMVVDLAVSGTSIAWWNSDTDSTGGAGAWKLRSGFAAAMFAASGYQASGFDWLQGTSDVTAYSTYAAAANTLQGYFNAALPTQIPLYLITPHQRSNDGPSTWPMRNVQWGIANSGGSWRLNCWLLDWELDADSSPHQSANAAGNRRAGPRLGRGWAKNFANSSLDILGPQKSSVAFTDTNRNVIEITFDRDIKLANGTAYAGSDVSLPAQLFSISTDSGATYGLPGSGFTVFLTGARKVQLRKSSTSWSQSTTYVDHLRNVPFTSDPTATDYIGNQTTGSLTANTTSGQYAITITARSGTVNVGDSVSGTGVPAGATLSVLPTTTGAGQLSIQATATNTGTAMTVTGAESSVETNFLSKVLTDTTTFDSSRGMPASPWMGGYQAQEAGSGSTAPRSGLWLGLGLGL